MTDETNVDTEGETALGRLQAVLPFLDIAVKGAVMESPSAQVLFGILSNNPDGSAKIVCSFLVEQFLQDLKDVVGYDQAKVDAEFAQALIDLRSQDEEASKKNEES